MADPSMSCASCVLCQPVPHIIGEGSGLCLPPRIAIRLNMGHPCVYPHPYPWVYPPEMATHTRHGSGSKITRTHGSRSLGYG